MLKEAHDAHLQSAFYSCLLLLDDYIMNLMFMLRSPDPLWLVISRHATHADVCDGSPTVTAAGGV